MFFGDFEAWALGFEPSERYEHVYVATILWTKPRADCLTRVCVFALIR